MLHRTIIKGAILSLAIWLALGLLRFRPWEHTRHSGALETLAVGFLPVT